jgi:hypothetical protein
MRGWGWPWPEKMKIIMSYLAQQIISSRGVPLEIEKGAYRGS